MGDKNYNKRKRTDSSSTENSGSKKNKRETGEKKIEKKKIENEKKNGERKNSLPRRPNADQENQNGCRSHSSLTRPGVFLNSYDLVLELNTFAKQSSSKQKNKKNTYCYTKLSTDFQDDDDDYAVIDIIYPSGQKEKFALASSSKFEYDPVDELFRFVETFIFYFINNGVKADDEVDEHSDPKPHTDIQKRFTYSKEGRIRNQNSIYRDLRSSLRTKRKDKFIEAINSFNSQMDDLVQNNDLKSFLNARKPESCFLEFILEQIYARCCSETDLPNITKAKSFSDATYGELQFALVEEMIQKAGINDNSTFIDLGCGIGNIVIHVNSRIGCDSYGVEFNEARFDIADRQVNEYKGRMALWGLDQTGTVEVMKADFLNSDYVVRLLRKADIVLTNNYAFTSSTNEALTRLFLDMKEGAKIISLKDFRTGANRNGPESILKVAKYSYPPDRNYVSWTNADGCYFVSTVKHN
ncbi:4938_t:CDS:2 [Funneliformis mosseae]|uniref:Histone-lysine N-methyltransferase, H3 lysine-79 specific n=1 Tax=Funneliformis mosseae TaxID=27381 RepID=A0A9N8WKK8_FUNMO|nr:4938_t:CDS:2 [Funneliformis mosseae]